MSVRVQLSHQCKVYMYKRHPSNYQDNVPALVDVPIHTVSREEQKLFAVNIVYLQNLDDNPSFDVLSFCLILL